MGYIGQSLCLMRKLEQMYLGKLVAPQRDRLESHKLTPGLCIDVFIKIVGMDFRDSMALISLCGSRNYPNPEQMSKRKFNTKISHSSLI